MDIIKKAVTEALQEKPDVVDECMSQGVPIWTKYSLNVSEAANYYGIGTKKIYEIIHDNPGADFLLEIGSHYRIKRVLFERFLDNATAV